jgi:peptidoglycan/LPS O-acetylase OafA/YrhL
VSTGPDGVRQAPILIFTVPTAVVILACVVSHDWWLPRLVDRRALRWFGKISYGLYIWHWPLLVAFDWELGLPLAIGAAVLSYRYIEQPFLRRKRPTVPAEHAFRSPPSVAVEPIRAPA